jgi:hypothetical protein
MGAPSTCQLELAPGPAEIVGKAAGWDCFEVAEGLVQLHREPQVLDAAADLGRCRGAGDEVVLEDLDAVEAGRGGGGELLLEPAAEADGGDRRSHGRSLR